MCALDADPNPFGIEDDGDVDDGTADEIRSEDSRRLASRGSDGDNPACPPTSPRASNGTGGGSIVMEPQADATVTSNGKVRCRRRGRLPKLKDMPLKARGAPGGPLRTPLHIGDHWQHMASYDVAKVQLAHRIPAKQASSIISFFQVIINTPIDLFTGPRHANKKEGRVLQDQMGRHRT